MTVTPLKPTLTRWPAVPSKTIKPVLFAVVMEAATVGPSTVTRPVYWTSAATTPGGATKNSCALMTLPWIVETEIGPVCAVLGTGTVMLVLVAVATAPMAAVKATRLLIGVVS